MNLKNCFAVLSVQIVVPGTRLLLYCIQVVCCQAIAD